MIRAKSGLFKSWQSRHSRLQRTIGIGGMIFINTVSFILIADITSDGIETI